MYPRTTAVDIGAFTGDYLMFRYGEVDMEFCDSMEMGIISLYNRVITGIRADYDQLLDEMDIDNIILLKPFLEQTGMLNRYRFIEDIHANAKGYDWLYQQGA